MAFFRRRVSFEEFGAEVLSTADQWLIADACRVLARGLEGATEYDASSSGGWIPFLERKGITKDQIRSYVAFVIHCSLHAVALQSEPDLRQRFVRGAMSSFSFAQPPTGYEFDRVYSLLEQFYSGSRRFSDEIERLKATDMRAHFLPSAFQSAGIVNARFVLSECIMPHMKIGKNVAEDFELFSSGISTIVGLVQRAANDVLGRVKL